MRTMKEFGKLIADKRKKAGLTQESFAGRLGITPQAVSKWENGIGYPDLTLFPAIAQTLNVSIDELFGESTANTSIRFPELYETLPLVFSHGNRACYSSKVTERIDSDTGTVYFEDGSTASLSDGLAHNKGMGEILFFEADEYYVPIPINAPTKINEPLPPFHSLVLSIGHSCQIEVLTAQDGMARIEANGAPQFVAAIRFEVKEEALNLTIKSTRNGNSPRESNHLRVYTGFSEGKRLKVSINGNGDCSAKPYFENVSLSINGNGEIELNDSKQCNVSINGNGAVKCRDVSEQGRLEINGCGDIEIASIRAPKLRINGSGAITLGEARESLDAKICGSGDIVAAGEVETLICKITGSGVLDGKALTVTDAELYCQGAGEIHLRQIKNSSTEKLGKHGRLYVKKRGR